jgi:hypothetical protein
VFNTSLRKQLLMQKLSELFGFKPIDNFTPI